MGPDMHYVTVGLGRLWDVLEYEFLGGQCLVEHEMMSLLGMFCLVLVSFCLYTGM
jgi:hypothetical protein